MNTNENETSDYRFFDAEADEYYRENGVIVGEYEADGSVYIYTS